MNVPAGPSGLRHRRFHVQPGALELCARREFGPCLAGGGRSGAQQSLEEVSAGGTDTDEHDGYVCRAIATKRDALSDREVIHWYHQRGEHSANRIKELKCDFASDWLPRGHFSANELYFALCALSYNLFALLRHLLPVAGSRSRAPTVRWRLIALVP